MKSANVVEATHPHAGSAPQAAPPAVPLTLDGSSVLHQMFRVRWAEWNKLPAETRDEIASEAVGVFAAMEQHSEGGSALFSQLGHKGDLILVHFRRSFEALNDAELKLTGLRLNDYLEPTTSYVSVVELGLYDSSVQLYEALAAQGEHPSWTLHMQIMPFEAAKSYRFNPFDLTKVWPHKDYPLVEVGRLTLNRNPTDFHTEIEQAAFEPNNLVPGIGLSPDKMLLGRGFAYSDAHRARLGVNYKQIPVNQPKVPVHSYSKDGAMRVHNVTDPVYAPNSYGGPKADPSRTDDAGLWYADGDMVRQAYTLRQDDDDWGQAGTLVREVMDDAARDRLVSNIVGHLKAGVSEPVLARAIEYWRNVDRKLGDRIAAGVQG
jgi:hypothetical protein